MSNERNVSKRFLRCFDNLWDLREILAVDYEYNDTAGRLTRLMDDLMEIEEEFNMHQQEEADE